ncbi:MAG TPA: AAA family ATPase [Polyangiaceae bacterium]|nr:AAA family ATPase [Polyangiaceae bacterium]
MTPEIVGRYTLVEHLGSGGVTESFRATATSIEGFERTVVVKRLLPALRGDPDLDDGLLTTLKPTVALSHANIAQILDVSTRDGVGSGRYWVTQHVLGWSLATLLQRAEANQLQLPVEMACYLALEATKALDYAHRLQPAAVIVHGNLSATNLLLSREGEVKVTDFGVALSLRRREPARPSASVGDDVAALTQIVCRCLLTGQSRELATGALLLENVSELRPDVPTRLLEVLTQTPSDAGEFHELLLEAISAERLRWSRSDLVQWLARHIATDSIPVKFESDAESVDVALDEPMSAPLSSVDVPVSSIAASSEDDLLPDTAVLSDAPGPSTSIPPEDGSLPPDSAEVPISIAPIDVAPGSLSASLLVLTPGASLGHSISAHVAALLQRAAHDIHWLPGGQLAVVLQQADGRDTEQAVRLGLALLRALGPTAKSSNIVVDLASFAATQLDRESCRFDPQAVAERATPLSTPVWHAPGRVIVSRRATRELRSLFRLKRAHDLGFAVMGSRSVEQASGPFFGRESDLDWLAGQVDELGPRGAIAVVGASGLGKTRLLLEFARRLRERSEAMKVCVAACPGRGQMSPYSAILALLARVCEIREGDIAPRELKRGSLLTEVASEDLARVQALLAESIVPTPGLDQELRDLLSRIVQARTRRTPHLIVLDGAHHADLTSRILLHDTQQVFGDRAMFVLLTRDDLVLHQLGLSSERQRLLQPLDDATVARLITARLGVSEAPDDLLAHFTRSAAGNPFVLEEQLREALVQGQITLGRNKVKSYDLNLRIEPPRSLRLLASPQ